MSAELLATDPKVSFRTGCGPGRGGWLATANALNFYNFLSKKWVVRWAYVRQVTVGAIPTNSSSNQLRFPG
jgi:hypothetical protein